MAGAAVQVTEDVQPIRVTPIVPTSVDSLSADASAINRSYFVDFGKEFTGGVRLVVEGGAKSGQVVHLRSGELCAPMVFDPTAFNGMGCVCTHVCVCV